MAEKGIDEKVDLGPTEEKELLKETEEALRVVKEYGKEIFSKPLIDVPKYKGPNFKTTKKRNYFFFGKLR